MATRSKRLKYAHWISPEHVRRGRHVAASTARHLPAAGGHLLAGTSDTGGGFTLIRTSVPARDSTPLHRHLEMDESFIVLDGGLDVTCGTDHFHLTAGDMAFLPRLVPHRYVAGPDVCEMLILATPGGLEGFFDDWDEGMGQTELAKRYRIEFLG